MKRSAYKLLIVFLAFAIVPGSLQAGDKEWTRKVLKSVEVSPGDMLKIINRHGDIRINTWDKDLLEATITISADANSEEKAEKKLNSIEIRERKFGNQIEWETLFSSSGLLRIAGGGLNIDYEINMPSTLFLELSNKYGNIYIGDMLEQVDIDLKNGNLTAGDLKGRDNKVAVSFGTGDIVHLFEGRAEISFGKLLINTAGDISVKTSSAGVRIEDVDKLEITGRLGSIEIGSVGEVRGTYGAGGFKIDELKQRASLTLKSAANLEIDEVLDGFEEIDVEGHFSSLEFDFDETSSFVLEAAIEHGKLIVNGEEEEPIESVDSIKTYSKNMGTGSAKAKVSVRNKYGNVRVSW